jgi:hypothetical protein
MLLPPAYVPKFLPSHVAILFIGMLVVIIMTKPVLVTRASGHMLEGVGGEYNSKQKEATLSAVIPTLYPIVLFVFGG